MAKIVAVVAMDEERAIGRAGTLPWHVPEDMKRFKALTTGHTVLMGRKTFDSLPERFKPLPNRSNVVISRTMPVTPGVSVYSTIDDAIETLAGEPVIFVIGGGEIYKATLPLWDEVRLTRVPGLHDGDTFLPPFEDAFALAGHEMSGGVEFCHYLRQKSAPS